jgi:hypothetical protein
MGIEISARGGPISLAEWDAIQALPEEELPPLTPGQQQAARQMRVKESDYARSVLARKRGAESMLGEVERFARFLRLNLNQRAPSLELTRVTLDTLKGKFEVEAKLDGQVLKFRVDEGLVDELFEGGSEVAEKRIERVIELALLTRVPQMDLADRHVTGALEEDARSA